MRPTVLIVEDNLYNIEICQDMFRYHNIPAELVVAQTGEESIRLAVDLRPDLILMDLRLPGMDGLEVTETLRGDPRTAHIPIWAITAYATPEDERKARAAGCSEYFVKPLHARLLSERICELLSCLGESATTPCVTQPS